MGESQSVSWWRRLSRWQRWSIIVCGALFFHALFGFFLLPLIVRDQLEKRLTAALARPTTVREVTFNPYTLECVINGFLVREREGEPFISFDSLRVNAQAISLVKRALVVQSCSLVNPFVGIVLHEDGRVNFADLLRANGATAEKKGGSERPLLISLNNIELLGGRIDFADRVKKVEHSITGLRIGIPFLSNLAYDVRIFTKPAFEATINGTSVKMAGESLPFYTSRQTELAVHFAGIDITRYLAYLPESFKFSIAEGMLDLDLGLSFLLHEDGNPAVKISGQAALRQVRVVDGAGKPLLVFPKLAVDIDRAHLLRREFHLRRIAWEKPEFFVERDKQGVFNFAGLVGTGADEEKVGGDDAAGSEKSLLEAAEIVVDGATLHYADHTNETAFVTSLRPVDVDVKNFSTVAGKTAEYHVALATESEERVRLEGASTLDPLAFSASVALDNIRPEKYRPYYDHVLRAGLTTEKSLVTAKIDFAAATNSLLVSEIGAELGGITVSLPDAVEKVTIPAFSLKGGSVDVKGKKVVLGQCAASGGTIPLVRREDKTMNVQDFLRASAGQPTAAAASPKKQEGGWSFLLEQVELADFAVDFADRVPGQAARFLLDRIHLTAKEVTNEAGRKAELALAARFGKSANLRTTGSLGLNPLDVRLALDWKDFPLAVLQPYLAEHVDLLVAGGRVGLTGKARYQAGGTGKNGFAFQGDLRSSKLNCLQGKQAEKLLSWETLQARKIDVTTDPPRVAVGELFADGLAANIMVDKNGVLNLNRLVKEGKKPPKKTAPAAGGKNAAQPDITIGAVSLVNGTLLFSDRSIVPRFDTKVESIRGQVSGLSSRKAERAKITIDARLDGHSPVHLSGSVHPWRDFFTDVSVDLGGVDLSRMTPYTIKYIGYPLTKGKLNLNLHYLVNGKELTAENNVFLDQITLGQFVKNDTAINAPVQLAISLLKNRAGEIDLDIPVSGRLDDPEFSIVGVVFKILTNLIVKAATSPFALLGSLFEGGGDRQFVRFAAGTDGVVADDVSMVEKLAGVLYERPAVRVELVGRFDRQEDAEVLRRIRFERLLKTQKMRDIAGKKQPAGGVDAIVIEPREYDEYLKKAYKDADFDRPKNFLGFLKDVPPGEMKKMLVDHIVISDGDLRGLAGQRAARIRDMLVEKGPVEPERIFLVEPEATDEKTAEREKTRVDILLR